MNYVDFLLDKVQDIGYLGVALIVGLEYACFPLPSEVVLPFIGILSSKAIYNIWIALLVSIIGGVVGSLICYTIGFYGGDKLITWLNTKFKGTVKSTEALNKWFKKYGNMAVFFSRLLPLTRTYVSFLAGAMKMSLKEFILYSISGITLWNAILISVGYFVGDNWDIIQTILTKYTKVSFVIGIIAVIGIVYLKRKKNNKKNYDI